MLTTLTPAQMKALEADFMAQTGVPGSVLMELAAHAVMEAVTRHAPSGSRVLFLCGPGNNGGDGYAAARLWRMAGGDAVVWELGEPATPDARMNRTLLTLQGVTPMPGRSGYSEGCACIVDALFGTGLMRPLDGACARLAELCNASRVPLVATGHSIRFERRHGRSRDGLPCGGNGDIPSRSKSAFCWDRAPPVRGKSPWQISASRRRGETCRDCVF